MPHASHFPALPASTAHGPPGMFSSRMCFAVPGSSLYTLRVYAQKLRVEVIIAGQRKPCPLDWLDAFSMRNFTNSAEFDDTLPLADGLIEASVRVKPARLAEALSAWLTQRGKGSGQPVTVEIAPDKSP